MGYLKEVVTRAYRTSRDRSHESLYPGGDNCPVRGTKAVDASCAYEHIGQDIGIDRR